jgi:hypothetical protein
MDRVKGSTVGRGEEDNRGGRKTKREGEVEEEEEGKRKGWGDVAVVEVKCASPSRRRKAGTGRSNM